MTNAKAIPPQGLDLTGDKSVDDEAFVLSVRIWLEVRDGIHYSSSDVQVIDDRSLVKSGQCITKGPRTYYYSPQTLSIVDCVSQIQSHGPIGSKIFIFHIGLHGQVGLEECKQYFSCNPQLRAVILWEDIIEKNWRRAQAEAIAKRKP